MLRSYTMTALFTPIPPMDAIASSVHGLLTKLLPVISLSRSGCMAGETLPMAQIRQNVLSRRQIEGLIADGRKIIILDGQVLKVDSWLRFHPGGDKAILHMVGRDGTDEMRALHSQEAQQRMRKFVIGRIEGRWTNFIPPIQGGHFRSLPQITTEHEEK